MPILTYVVLNQQPSTETSLLPVGFLFEESFLDLSSYKFIKTGKENHILNARKHKNLCTAVSRTMKRLETRPGIDLY